MIHELSRRDFLSTLSLGAAALAIGMSASPSGCQLSIVTLQLDAGEREKSQALRAVPKPGKTEPT